MARTFIYRDRSKKDGGEVISQRNLAKENHLLLR